MYEKYKNERIVLVFVLYLLIVSLLINYLCIGHKLLVIQLLGVVPHLRSLELFTI